MPATRVRVRAPCDVQVLVVLSALFAALSGAVLSLSWVRPGFPLLPCVIVLPPNLQLLVSYGDPVLLVVPWALLVHWRSQQPLALYLAGQVFGSCYVIGFWLVTIALSPGGGGAVALQGWAIIAVVSVVIGVVFGLINLLLRVFTTSFLFIIVEQDGTLCYRCGYKIGAVPISARCPECGTQVSASTAHGELSSRSSKRARVIVRIFAIVALAVFLVTWGKVYTKVSRPTDRFLDQFEREQNAFTGPMFGRGPNVPGWEAIGTYYPVPGDPTKLICIMYEPDPVPGQPAMQVQLRASSQVRSGKVLPVFGDPLILCDITTDEAVYVIEHGLPRSLEAAFVDAASAVGWIPLPAGVGPSKVAVILSADGHFPSSSDLKINGMAKE